MGFFNSRKYFLLIKWKKRYFVESPDLSKWFMTIKNHRYLSNLHWNFQQLKIQIPAVQFQFNTACLNSTLWHRRQLEIYWTPLSWQFRLVGYPWSTIGLRKIQLLSYTRIAINQIFFFRPSNQVPIQCTVWSLTLLRHTGLHFLATVGSIFF